MVPTAGERSEGLVDEQAVYAALAAIDQTLQRALTAETEQLRRRELVQLRALLMTLPTSGLDLKGDLRHLIEVLRMPILEG
jgi:hypothetical protein